MADAMEWIRKEKKKMTESVMCTGTKEEKNVHTDIMFKLPRNVRQIGQEKGGQKLYLEDYVVTFLKEMTHKNSMEFQFAVLLGNIIHLKEEVCVFVNGAVEAEDIIPEIILTHCPAESTREQRRRIWHR